MEVTQQEERIGPNCMKLVQRFVYLLPKVRKKIITIIIIIIICHPNADSYRDLSSK